MLSANEENRRLLLISYLFLITNFRISFLLLRAAPRPKRKYYQRIFESLPYLVLLLNADLIQSLI